MNLHLRALAVVLAVLVAFPTAALAQSNIAGRPAVAPDGMTGL